MKMYSLVDKLLCGGLYVQVGGLYHLGDSGAILVPGVVLHFQVTQSTSQDLVALKCTLLIYPEDFRNL